MATKNQIQELAKKCGLSEVYYSDAEMIRVAYKEGGRLQEKVLPLETYETLMKTYEEPKWSLWLNEVIGML